jgi:outer membrane protein, multidrug efflux system
MIRFSPMLLPVLLSTACAPRPQLAIAPTILSEEWQQPVAPAGVEDGRAGSWADFGSGELQRLIDRARARNVDIAIAGARIVQARGQLRIARAAALPAVSATASFSADDQSGSASPAQRVLTAGADVSWEADLFGGIAAGRKAARARFAAATFDRDAIALLIEAEVARAYFDHAALGERITLVDRSLENARELERIILVQVREGAATRVDAGRQSVEVRRIEAQRSELVEAQIHTRNALAVLVGEEAPRFAGPEGRLADLALPALRPGQPSDLLLRRPDVRAAEARIAAAEGDVAQARAAFLPRITLSAGALLQDAAGPVQLIGALGQSLLAPIFDAGRLKGRLAVAQGTQHEAVEAYRGALLAALRDAEDALAACAEAERRRLLLAATIEEARRTAGLARRQFVEGAADLQTVLDAERSLLDVEQEHALAVRDRLGATVTLVAAMGGWPASA